MNYLDTLTAETASWLIEDPAARSEKFKRERIRHHGIVKALKLRELGTAEMDVLEVGGGPMPVSDLLPFRSRIVVDPLTTQYERVISCPDHLQLCAEEMGFEAMFDLVVATNSLDHVEDPDAVLARMCCALRPRGYIAILCAANNALTNPHPAHVHNLTADWVHRALDRDFETVWALTYEQDEFRYGWVPYEGKRGQPAFALLMRHAA